MQTTYGQEKGFAMKQALTILPLATILAVAGCASGGRPHADVVRFHDSRPLERGSLAVVPVNSDDADSLEFRTHAETIAAELRRHGYRTGVPENQAQYVATVDITQIHSSGGPEQSGVSLRIGGGIGIGRGAIGGSVPVSGKTKMRTNVTTTLSVRISQQADKRTIWEGRAVQEISAVSPEASPATVVPALANALFRDFPGPSGQTIRVPLQ